MSIQESGEMYLETILILGKQKPQLRAIDICEYMGYSKPSVSRGLSILKKNGYVHTDENGFISLTTSGKKISEKIYERHIILSNFLEKLGVDKETASSDACRIEHVISEDSFEAIKKLTAK